MNSSTLLTDSSPTDDREKSEGRKEILNKNTASMMPTKILKNRQWFLTDVLLFTHLVHLPAAYASKTVL